MGCTASTTSSRAVEHQVALEDYWFQIIDNIQLADSFYLLQIILYLQIILLAIHIKINNAIPEKAGGNK